MSDNTLRDRFAAWLATDDDDADADDDGEASPRARDERPIVIGREEHTETPDKEDVNDWIEEYENNPFIRVPIQNFAADVTEPGVAVRVGQPNDDEDVPTVPDDYPNDEYAGEPLDDALKQWLSSSYIDGWSFDGDVTDLLETVVKDRRGRRGTAVVEHAWDEPEDRNQLLALRPIKLEHLTAYTREGKAIVLRPDDNTSQADSLAAASNLDSDDRNEAPTTPAGKTAALVQYDDVYGSKEADEIPFALSDVTVSAYDAGTGALFGRPDSASVLERAESLRKKLNHIDQGVLNTAFANVIATIETDNREMAEKIRDDLKVNSPESVSGTNVPHEITELDGEVPDAEDIIQREIEYILAAMPTPLYRVGFAGDINRDVTDVQQEDYRDQVKRERRRLEADFRKPLVQKAREFLYGDPFADETLEVDVRLEIQPEESDSPLKDEEFDADEFSSVMSGISSLSSKAEPPTEILPKEVMVETFLGMDADDVYGDADEAAMEALDEADPRVQETFARSTTSELSVADDWNPAEHPRGEDGKFIESPGGETPSIENLGSKLAAFAEGEMDLPEGVEPWRKSEPGQESLQEGQIIKVDDTKPSLRDPNKNQRSKIYRVEEVHEDGTATAIGIAGRHEGTEREINLDASGKESNPGSRYSSTYYPTGILRSGVVDELETEAEKIDRILENLSSEQKVKAAQYVAQHGSPSDSKLPQFSAVFDSLTQNELRKAFTATATSKLSSGNTRNLNISWFENGVPGEDTGESPGPLTANHEKLGYFTSRMDGETMQAAVREALDTLSDDSNVRERVIKSAAYYGKSADARLQTIEQYHAELEDDDVVKMQQAESSDEFVDAFLTRWVESETSAVTQHLILASQSVGPNTPKSTSTYTTGLELFADGSEGVPLAEIEPTEQMRSAIEELSREATEYHRENGTPDLYRGVRNEITTHGTVESWSKSQTVADSFDGHAVLEATVNPEDILISQDMLGDKWPQPENIKRSEEEFILFGGAFGGK